MRTFLITDGDYTLNRANGQPIMVTGRDKLRQDVRECCTIAVQPNGFGMGLTSLLGQDVDPIGYRMVVAQSVRSGIATLQRLQDVRRTWRLDSERIAAVSKLEVGQVNLGAGKTAKTGYSFRLAVRPFAGATVNMTGAIA